MLEVKKDGGLKLLQTGRPVEGYTNPPETLSAHLAITKQAPRFRFPPEPNGFLHIGHAKAMNLSFGCAAAHGGHCYLRYDDTNPESEEQVYIDSIRDMVEWLGWRPHWITHSSDYFETLYELAVQLIKDGKAYVDHSTGEQLRKQREERVASPWRESRSRDENLTLFEHMRQGRYEEGAATLRVKIDMTHDNPNMRDFIAYRVRYSPHPASKDRWCIYPSYDFTHAIVDSLEHVDYSLCTLEFETRRESYFWLLDALHLWRPHVWEFSRLNVTGSLLSKRKINELVKRGIVRGFDDPRLLTLAGLRRRGFTAAAVNHFCELLGITRSMNVIQVGMLENALREDLDERCLRRQLVVDPVKVVVDNWEEALAAEEAVSSNNPPPPAEGAGTPPAASAGTGKTVNGERHVQCPQHPRKPELGDRTVAFTREFYIDRSDFHEVDDNPKYYGLAPCARPVGLKYCGNIVCTSFERADGGSGSSSSSSSSSSSASTSSAAPVSLIHVTIDLSRSVRPKTNITWVSAKYAVPIETRLYTYLLKDDRAATDPDFLQFIDDTSETVVPVSYGEPAVLQLQPPTPTTPGGGQEGSSSSSSSGGGGGGGVKVFDSFQAERFGYFVVDPDSDIAGSSNSSGGGGGGGGGSHQQEVKKLVLNRTIGLKEDKEKATGPAAAGAPAKKEPAAPKKEKGGKKDKGGAAPPAAEKGAAPPPPA